MTPHKIWIEQCEAARGIEAEFGTCPADRTFDPSLYDDEEEAEMERQLELRKSAAELLLVERAREWLLGKGSDHPET